MSGRTKPRIWRYEVVSVWGSMVGRIEAGQVIYDKWKADRSWFVMNFTTMEEGGFNGKLLGEADAEQTAKIHAKMAEGRVTDDGE